MARLIVIAGPTASGKTALSIELAQELNAEIISADSRQLYRKMDIGTAKPIPAEQSAVPHHFIDILDPGEDYNAGRFEKDAIAFLDDYFLRKDTALLVGGSGLYINAVTQGLDALPKSTPTLREKWNALYDRNGLEALQSALETRDPQYAQTVDMSNRQRIQRALEAMDASGVAFSTLLTRQQKTRPFHCDLILLEPARDALYDRINQRVDHMIQNGLEEEVRSLMPHRHCNALNTVGYKEMIDYFDGHMTLEEAISKIKQHTRNYAKRQYTWFRAQKGYASFSGSDKLAILKHLQQHNHV